MLGSTKSAVKFLKTSGRNSEDEIKNILLKMEMETEVHRSQNKVRNDDSIIVSNKKRKRKSNKSLNTKKIKTGANNGDV